MTSDEHISLQNSSVPCSSVHHSFGAANVFYFFKTILKVVPFPISDCLTVSEPL
jgi:hypothetical protein